jgi:hypothetical protein
MAGLIGGSWRKSTRKSLKTLAAEAGRKCGSLYAKSLKTLAEAGGRKSRIYKYISPLPLGGGAGLNFERTKKWQDQ